VTTSDPIELTAEIVAAFVSRNSVPRSELSALFEAVHTAVAKLANGGESAPIPVEAQAPAVSIRKSVTPDYLICLEDGKQFKSLRRHLTGLGLTPELYRVKWNLPQDYPMVAPNYAAERSALAKKIGLGQLRKKPVAPKGAASPKDGKRKLGRSRRAPAELAAS
jgi:predicted transcriptional regulator